MFTIFFFWIFCHVHTFWTGRYGFGIWIFSWQGRESIRVYRERFLISKSRTAKVVSLSHCTCTFGTPCIYVSIAVPIRIIPNDLHLWTIKYYLRRRLIIEYITRWHQVWFFQTISCRFAFSRERLRHDK